MTKKKAANKDMDGKAEEPQAEYSSGNGNKTLRFFSSFEEMNEADAAEVAKFTPEQHLQHATELIQHIYADELKKKFSGYTIYFK